MTQKQVREYKKMRGKLLSGKEKQNVIDVLKKLEDVQKQVTLKQEVNQVVHNADVLIAACKAKGGYKYRESFQCSDRELELILRKSETQLRWIMISLLIAEKMMKESPPSIHPRWDEYERRRKEAIREA